MSARRLVGRGSDTRWGALRWHTATHSPETSTHTYIHPRHIHTERRVQPPRSGAQMCLQASGRAPRHVRAKLPSATHACHISSLLVARTAVDPCFIGKQTKHCGTVLSGAGLHPPSLSPVAVALRPIRPRSIRCHVGLCYSCGRGNLGRATLSCGQPHWRGKFRPPLER